MSAVEGACCARSTGWPSRPSRRRSSGAAGTSSGTPGPQAPARPRHRRCRRVARRRGRGRPRRSPPATGIGVPVTPRGAGTGNYGQAMPLRGGVVLDLSEMNAVKAIGHGRVRAPRPAPCWPTIDAATRATARQELRLHPSTYKTATIGGFIAGGSRRRLDQLGRPARPRQRPMAARRDHGGRAARPRAERRRHAEGHPRLRHQRHHHRGRDAAGAAYRWVDVIVGFDDSWRPPCASPTRSRARTRSSRSWSP